MFCAPLYLLILSRVNWTRQALFLIRLWGIPIFRGLEISSFFLLEDSSRTLKVLFSDLYALLPFKHVTLCFLRSVLISICAAWVSTKLKQACLPTQTLRCGSVCEQEFCLCKCWHSISCHLRVFSTAEHLFVIVAVMWLTCVSVFIADSNINSDLYLEQCIMCWEF